MIFNVFNRMDPDDSMIANWQQKLLRPQADRCCNRREGLRLRLSHADPCPANLRP